MTTLKCKMCGGDIKLSADKTYGICEFCGSTMTLPKTDDEQRVAMFNRGNHFRRIGEFDKALMVYESLLQENEADAEAHWCCALCRFGIEYVKDPASGEYMPTCHRASFDSFLEDVDTREAIKHADAVSKSRYEHDAQVIEDVRRSILMLSQNEEPYDVFICYKEVDEQGQRTIDSQRAQEIYYLLKDQGRRVFFSRISLEDKAGQQYEPYIFAALNSAKVMVVVGTRREYLESVWVKNEWSRYLAIVKRDRKKLLIPCYADMDPYDMPEQLSILQSYDMTKIGFFQDLIRGINKVLDVNKQPVSSPATQNQAALNNVSALLKRGYMALEDGEWVRADAFFEQVLNQNAECAEAYMGKYLCQRHMASLQELVRDRIGQIELVVETVPIRCDEEHIENMIQRYAVPNYLTDKTIRNLYTFSRTYSSAEKSWENARDAEASFWGSNKNLARAIQYARADYKKELDNARRKIMDYIGSGLQAAKQSSNEQREKVEAEYKTFLAETDRIVEQQNKNAVEHRERYYIEACKAQTAAEQNRDEKCAAEALQIFQAIGDYKDCLARQEQCASIIAEAYERKQQQASIQAEKQRKRRRKSRWIACTAAMVAFLMIAIAAFALENYGNVEAYSKAERLLQSGEKKQAAIAFGRAAGYRDARERCYSLLSETKGTPIVTAGNVAYALKTDGTVVTSSDSYSGVNNWTDIVSLAAGEEYVVGLKSDGTIALEGTYSENIARALEWTDIIAISATRGHIVGLKRDGTLVTVGVGIVPAGELAKWRDIQAIASGKSRIVALRLDGTVAAIGVSIQEQGGILGWTDIVAIAVGDSHIIGLTAGGSVVAVGRNDEHQTDVQEWKDIVAIAAGDSHTVGLKADGTVVTTQDVDEDDMDWLNIAAIAASDQTTFGIRSDGRVVNVGEKHFLLATYYSSVYDVDSWTEIAIPK